jgi:hypothetical protein
MFLVNLIDGCKYKQNLGDISKKNHFFHSFATVFGHFGAICRNIGLLSHASKKKNTKKVVLG